MAYAMTPTQPGLEEPRDQIHETRITLSSKNVKDLGKVCGDLIRGAKDKRLRVKGPVRISTKVRNITTKKSPCGEVRLCFRTGGKKQKIASGSASQQDSMTPEEKKRYTKFLARRHLSTRFYHEPSMRALRVHEEIVRLFTGSGLQGFLEVHEDTYPALTSEFLATVEVNTDYANRGALKFMLGGVRRVLSLDQLNTALNVPPQQPFLQTDDGIAQRMWYKITGQEQLFCKEAYVNAIYHPVFKIVQKILGNTIYGRAECSKTRMDEVMCLYYMTHGRPFDLGYEFVQKLKALANSKSGDVCIGGLITRLALALDVDLKGREMVACRWIDSTHLMKVKALEHMNADGSFDAKLPNGQITTFRERTVLTIDRNNWYKNLAQQALQRWSDDSESPDNGDEEGEESKEGSDDEEDEEESDDEDEEGEDEGSAHMDLDAPGPSKRRSKRSHDRPSSRQGGLHQQMAALSEQMCELLRSNKSLEAQISQLYRHSFGHFYDPNAPYPPPPPLQ